MSLRRGGGWGGGGWDTALQNFYLSHEQPNRPYQGSFVTLFWKTDHVVTFSISRNTHFKYSMGCSSPMVQYSHATPTTLSSLVI